MRGNYWLKHASQMMDWLGLLKGFASVATVVAAILVAANISPKLMVSGFAIFILASLAWICAGLLQDDPSLYFQNLLLLIINAFGFFRWLPRAV